MDNVVIEARKVDGELVSRQTCHNDVVRSGWAMFPVLFGSGQAYTFKVNKMKAGSSTQVVQVSDPDLVAPWSSFITAGRATENAASLVVDYGIPPNSYVGQVVAELGFYYDVDSGVSPVTVPALFSRVKVPAPITIAADVGVYISHTIGASN